MSTFSEREKLKFVESLDYQRQVVDVVDLNTVLRAVCSAIPGVHERPKRTIDFSLPGRPGTRLLKVGDAQTPAPVPYDKAMGAAKMLAEALVVDGKLREDWCDIVSGMDI